MERHEKDYGGNMCCPFPRSCIFSAASFSAGHCIAAERALIGESNPHRTNKHASGNDLPALHPSVIYLKRFGG